MKKLFPLLAFLISFQISAQEDAWVYLKDKPSQATFLATPLTMLSQRALDRRTRQNIVLDSKDVPLEASYYTQIKNAVGITVLAKSKWLNAIHVQGTQNNINNLKTNYSFVDKVEFANRALNAKSSRVISAQKKQKKYTVAATDINYGSATNQVEMLKGDYLHEQGFTGSGMHIAVIDGGFANVNTLDAFKKIRDNNQILGGYDYVKRNADFYVKDFSNGNIVNTHGTKVLSTIAGNLTNQYVGTAPDASYYLFITEDVFNEVPLEESLWVEAAERSDSLGVDVINTSLGYSVYFDETKYNYSYADMNGTTAFISKGAAIGVSRGMIIVTSAGNEGNDPWKYMNAPADVATVFTVGAVNASRVIAPFSSFGPTSDGRVKPDVLAQGQSAVVINHLTSAPQTGNGTSYSSPIMTGVVACFWQAFPNATNTEIMQRIRESADRYSNPHEQYGYGIPNFETAYAAVLNIDKEKFMNGVSVYPNPINSRFSIQTNAIDINSLSIQIYNVIGKKVFEKVSLESNTIDVSHLNAGIYILKIMYDSAQKTIKLVKR